MRESDNKGGRPLNDYVKFTGMGFQMVAIIGIFAFAGYQIDNHAHHQQRWVTALMALAGVFIALYVVISSIRKS